MWIRNTGEYHWSTITKSCKFEKKAKVKKLFTTGRTVTLGSYTDQASGHDPMPLAENRVQGSRNMVNEQPSVLG